MWARTVANIAEIGFAADSSQLRSAKSALDQLSPAAHNAEAAAGQLSSSMTKVEAAAAGVAAGSKAAAAALGRQETATQATAAAGKSHATAATAAANAIDRQVQSMNALIAAQQRAAFAAAGGNRSATDAAAAAAAAAVSAARQGSAGSTRASTDAAAAAAAAAVALARQEAAATSAAAAQQRVNAASTGNHADTAAKAAATALDQQAAAAAAAATAQSKLNEATARVNGMGLNTANLAAQFQDIAVTAAAGMNPLMIALQQGTQISAALQASATGGASALAQIGMAAKSVVSPLSLMTIGIIGAGAALLQLVPWTKLAAGTLRALANGFGYMKSAIQAAAPFVLALAAAFVFWNIPLILSGIVSLTGVVYGLAKALLIASLTNPFILIPLAIAAAIAGIIAFKKQLSEAIGKNVIDEIKKPFNLIIGLGVAVVNTLMLTFQRFPTALQVIFAKGVSSFKVFANEILEVADKAVRMLPTAFGGSTGIEFRFDPTWSVTAEKSAIELADKYRDAVKSAFETDYIGGAAAMAGRGVDAIKKKLNEWANKLDEVNKKYKKLVDGIKSQIAIAQVEQRVIGMSIADAEHLRAMTELLNKAREDGLKLTPKMIDQLDQYARMLGTVKDATEKLRDAFDFSKDIVKGFITDLRDSLVQGESILKAFANAASNILNKVFDKLISRLVDLMFESKTGANGGLMGWLVKLAGGLTGATDTSGGWSTTVTPAPTAMAKGDVVGGPTMFKFARGGSFHNGVMGENGPEGVLPLKRGPDGSLGVQMVGSNDNNGRGATTTVNIYNNADGTQVEQRRTRDSQGNEMIDVIVSAVKNKMATGEFDTSMKSRYGNGPVKKIRG